MTTAPKNHHYAPRFLLRGFASRTKGSETYVWVFPASRPAFEANVRNVGAENYFYEEETEGRLAQLDGRFAEFVTAVRETESVSASQQHVATEFVVNLVTRSRHLRDSFTEMGTKAVAAIADGLADPVRRRDFVRKTLVNGKAQFMAELRRLMGIPEGVRLPGDLEEKVVEFEGKIFDHAYCMFDRGLLDTTGVEEAMDRYLGASYAYASDGSLAAAGHNKALRGELLPRAHLAKYEHLVWRVERSPQPLILGDIGPIARTASGTTYEHPMSVGEELISVVLPLSPGELLVGDASHAPPWSAEEVNVAMAELSRLQIYASRNTEAEGRYHGVIGKRADVVSDEDIAAAREML